MKSHKETSNEHKKDVKWYTTSKKGWAKTRRKSFAKMTHRIRMNEILEQWSFCRRANIDWTPNESQKNVKNNEKFVKIKNVLIKKYSYKDIHYWRHIWTSNGFQNNVKIKKVILHKKKVHETLNRAIRHLWKVLKRIKKISPFFIILVFSVCSICVVRYDSNKKVMINKYYGDKNRLSNDVRRCMWLWR